MVGATVVADRPAAAPPPPALAPPPPPPPDCADATLILRVSVNAVTARILKDADCQLDIGRKRCRITMDPGLTSQTTRRAHSFPTSRLTQWWSGIPPSQLKPDQEMDEVRVSGAGYRSGARN